MEGGGRWIVLFSEVTLFKYTVCQKFCWRVAAQILQFLNTLDCLESKMIFVSLLIGVASTKKHNANCRLQ